MESNSSFLNIKGFRLMIGDRKVDSISLNNRYFGISNGFNEGDFGSSNNWYLNVYFEVINILGLNSLNLGLSGASKRSKEEGVLDA